MSQSVARALSILSRVAGGTTTLAGLAEAEGVHKSTVLRLLRSLEEGGFVRHDDEHRYSLGGGLFRLAQQALESFEVRAAAAPRLRALRDETGQTVHLAGWDGRCVVYVDKHEPQHAPVRMASRIGLAAPLHSTAVGKVLLAGLDAAGRRDALAGVAMPARTPRTITTPEALLAEVDAVAARGWAVDHGEDESFINCVAAPVRGPDGAVVAAVSISVPDVLLPYGEVLGLVPALLAATADVSRECGWTGAPPTTIPPGGNDAP